MAYRSAFISHYSVGPVLTDILHAHLGTSHICCLIHVWWTKALVGKTTHIHTVMKFLSSKSLLKDSDNIKTGLGKGRSCHNGLLELGYRTDPLLGPFITKRCMIPVGLWSRECERKGEAWRKERQTMTGDRSRQVIMCAPSQCPFLVILHLALRYGCLRPRPICWTSCLVTNRVKGNQDCATLTSTASNTSTHN